MANAVGLYLIVEAIPGPAALDRLKAALAAAPIASVLITAHTSRPLDASGAKPYVELIQAQGVAALIDGDAQLARILRADGVHLRAPAGIAARGAVAVSSPAALAPEDPGHEAPDDAIGPAYAGARQTLGARCIVGADAGGTRHGAMELGELGADYVAFSGPGQVERVAWWAEIFEVACVAFDVAAPDDAEALAQAGVDFVAFALPGGASAADGQDLVRRFARAVGD